MALAPPQDRSGTIVFGELTEYVRGGPSWGNGFGGLNLKKKVMSDTELQGIWVKLDLGKGFLKSDQFGAFMKLGQVTWLLLVWNVPYCLTSLTRLLCHLDGSQAVSLLATPTCCLLYAMHQMYCMRSVRCRCMLCSRCSVHRVMLGRHGKKGSMTTKRRREQRHVPKWTIWSAEIWRRRRVE